MGQRFFQTLTAVAGIALLCLWSTRAQADVIDGDWCNAEGKQMTIRGPEIVTPGGKQMRGDYTRHSFSYVVPAGEEGAGESVSIILRSELLAHSRQGKADTPWQEWRRCTAKISWWRLPAG
jgi:hypothetical protein